MYSKLPNLVITFHGCDESVRDRVICGGERLLPSTNDYDWLGSGIYFWEQNYERARLWAEEQSARREGGRPAVIEHLHARIEEEGLEPFDSARGLFSEGGPIYEGAGFNRKTHVQICVRNPNCIKGYFSPMDAEEGWRIP